MKRVAKAAVLVALLAFYSFFLLQKIDLTTSDIGRHLKNGEQVLKGDFSVVSKNAYSYTEPDFEVPNHHWISGVLFRMVYGFSGFAGLSYFYLALFLAALLLSFGSAARLRGFRSAVVFSFFLLPMATRYEIRPEVFSYLLAALFFYLLSGHREGRFQTRLLWILPPLMVFWVNAHIYFFLGLFLAAVFWLDDRLASKKGLGPIVAACAAAALLNPMGLKGALYPFTIFQNFGYRLLENQSVVYLERLNFVRPSFFYLKLALAFVMLTLLVYFLKKSKNSRFPLAYGAVLAAVSAMACLAIRNFSVFGLMALPCMSYFSTAISGGFPPASFLRRVAPAAVLTALSVLLWFTHADYFKALAAGLGAGIAPGNQAAGEFFQKTGLRGPIFNNYDIGGYLIFYLYPGEKVFVDNRPEAYPADFFEKVYVPAQEDENRWKEMDSEYGFNAVFFGYHDYTPWAQKFLIDRVSDPVWAPVYADAYAVIFLKRNAQNEALIRRYELPKSTFRVISNE